MSAQRPRSRRGLWHKGWPDHAALRVEVNVVVPFQDADPTGVAWHGNYFRYYDAARTALLAKLNFGYRRMAKVGQLWPIVDTRVRYRRSIVYGESVIVSAQLVEWDFRLLIYYEIRDGTGRLVNEAYTSQAPVSAESESLIVGTPKFLRDRIEGFIAAASDGGEDGGEDGDE